MTLQIVLIRNGDIAAGRGTHEILKNQESRHLAREL